MQALSPMHCFSQDKTPRIWCMTCFAFLLSVPEDWVASCVSLPRTSFSPTAKTIPCCVTLYFGMYKLLTFHLHSMGQELKQTRRTRRYHFLCMSSLAHTEPHPAPFPLFETKHMLCVVGSQSLAAEILSILKHLNTVHSSKYFSTHFLCLEGQPRFDS